jgi:hypothetical protein
MFRLLNNLYSPADSNTPTPPQPTGDTSREDMIEFLSSDDEKEEIKLDKAKNIDDKTTPKTEKTEEEDKEDTEVEEEEDELAEIEKELEGPTDEQLELVTPVRRKEILAKYPGLFKDFPYLEKAYYREQQFTEIYPTIEDARTAASKSEILDKFEKELIGGKSESILKAVKEENPNSFAQIVDDYLPALARVDEQAYYHVLGNITKHTIQAMAQEANRSNNKVLMSAAQIVNQFAFGSSDFSPPTNLAKDTGNKPEDNKFNEREQKFVKTQFTNTQTDLNTKVNNTLRNTIESNIDPKKSMTDFVRKHATREAIDTIQGLIQKDGRFIALADKLWEKAFEDNFSRESTDRIKSAYLSKAKTLLPAVIKKARNDALKGMGKRVTDDTNIDDDSSDKKGPVAPGRPRSQSPSGKVRNAKDIPKGMSTLDFLNAD